MQKEKKVRSYQRRTKSGKMVTVKAHTAKYDAADKDKEMTKKEGAGKELEERKKKAVQLELPFDKESEKKVLEEVKEAEEKPKKKKVRPVGSGTNGPVPKKKTTTKKETTEPAFTAAEFKEWYQGTGSAADKKVAKALRAQLGRSGYRKLEDEAIDGYSSRGHLSMFKRVSGGASSTGAAKSATSAKDKSKDKDSTPKSKNVSKPKRQYSDAYKNSLEKSKSGLVFHSSSLGGVTPMLNGKVATPLAAERHLASKGGFDKVGVYRGNKVYRKGNRVYVYDGDNYEFVPASSMPRAESSIKSFAKRKLSAK